MDRVPIDQFLKELEESLEDNTIGSGDPAEYDIRWALNDQIKRYVLERFRTLLKGQQFVLLPDAVDIHNSEIIWRREDWDEIDYDDY
jgi:hypothetical protein